MHTVQSIHNTIVTLCRCTASHVRYNETVFALNNVAQDSEDTHLELHRAHWLEGPLGRYDSGEIKIHNVPTKFISHKNNGAPNETGDSVI